MVHDETSKLQALTDISSIDITLEFNVILENILRITCETMNAHSGTIMLADDNTRELYMVASYNLGPDYIDKVYDAARHAGVSISSSPSGTVLATGTYYLVPDVFKEPKDEPWYELTKEVGFASQIYGPMKQGTKVIGLLNVYMSEPHEFIDEEINFVTIAASQAASVVQNARICSRLKDNIHELKDFKEHLEAKVQQASRELYESEARYRELFENAYEAIYTSDCNGNFLTMNKAGLAIFNCTEAEIIGTCYSDWLAPESKEIAQENLKRIIADQSVKLPVIREIIRKNGEHRWIEVTVRAIKDDNRIIGLHGMLNDITEKKDMELKLRYYHEKLRMSFEKLKIAEMKYRDLFENASDGMYRHDIQGVFHSINKSGLEIFNCSEEEFIGTHYSEWLTTDSLKSALEVMEDFIAGKPVKQPIQLEIIDKAGHHKFCEIKISVVTNAEVPIAVYGIIRDVSEKIRSENELAAYYKQLEASFHTIKEADRLKTDFILNISHELLTPLTAIRGFAELILDGKVGVINNEQKKSLKTILRNSDRLLRLSKNLAAFVQFVADKMDFPFEPILIEDVLSLCIQDARPRFEEKEITLVQDIKALPPILGNKELLIQALSNLFVYVVAFIPEKKMVQVTAKENPVTISIDISDIGIPPDQTDEICDRFFQADGSVCRKYGGAGLGLAICKNIIEMHKGTICATSEGNGTFKIILPKYQNTEKTATSKCNHCITSNK